MIQGLPTVYGTPKVPEVTLKFIDVIHRDHLRTPLFGLHGTLRLADSSTDP